MDAKKFVVGESWKTNGGQTAHIIEINESREVYPIRGSIDDLPNEQCWTADGWYHSTGPGSSHDLDVLVSETPVAEPSIMEAFDAAGIPVTGKTFVVGQKWKTRGGRNSEIVSITRDSKQYPIGVKNQLGETSGYTIEGQYYPGEESPYDLVELVSEPQNFDETGRDIAEERATSTAEIRDEIAQFQGEFPPGLYEETVRVFVDPAGLVAGGDISPSVLLKMPPIGQWEAGFSMVPAVVPAVALDAIQRARDEYREAAASHLSKAENNRLLAKMNEADAAKFTAAANYFDTLLPKD
jgi:hypothetical protein